MGALEAAMGQVSVWGRMKGKPPEKIDSGKDLREAMYLAGEYKLAFGHEWVIWAGRRDQEPGKEPPR